jgi:hypothetical protein
MALINPNLPLEFWPATMSLIDAQQGFLLAPLVEATVIKVKKGVRE